MNAAAWSQPVSDAEATKRAGGRRVYNLWRHHMMLYRRRKVWRMIFCKGRLLERGIRAKIARKLGVSRNTISQDVKALLKAGHPCPECGAYCYETLTDPFDDSKSANPVL